MAKLLYQGHGSCRIVSENGTVLYVDPFAGEGYYLPADIVLVTHEHRDHNDLSLITKNRGCRVLRAKDMLIKGEYQTKVLRNISVRAVPAYNKNHDASCCVGYILSIDGVQVYLAGDTSATDYMKTSIAHENIDYALLPIDGVYNMDAKEASQCAAVIGAKHTIPVHMKPGSLFDENTAQSFRAEGRLILHPSEEITL